MGTKSNKFGLTRQQLRAAEMLANPDFTGTVTSLCEEIGVARSTFYKWLGNGEFRRHVDDLIGKYTDSELSRVWKALMRCIDAGDLQAIRLYFDLKGKYGLTGAVRTEEGSSDGGTTLAAALDRQAGQIWDRDKA